MKKHSYTKIERDCFERGTVLSNEIVSLISDDTIGKHLDDCPNIKSDLETNPYLAEMLCLLAEKDYLKERFKERDSEEQKQINATKLVDRITKKRRHLKLRKIVLGASSIAAALVISFLLFPKNLFVSEQSSPLAIIEVESKAEMPILALDNGTQITLNGDTSFVSTDGTITTLAKDVLAIKKGKNLTATNAPEYMTLIVPSRFTYKAILPDGSEVIVNANSELRYPSTFVGDQREVYLKGEAYFSVTKSDKPFLVKVENADIKVYGTKFNVNARKILNTVLVEGKVGVTIGREELLMRPNQMLTYNKSKNEKQLQNVNPALYIGWLSGFFSCEQKRLEDFLSDVESWYGVEFTLATDRVKNIEISAMIDKSMPLEKTLLLLEEMIVDVKFNKEGGSKYNVE